MSVNDDAVAVPECVDVDTLRRLHRGMVRVRRAEEAVIELLLQARLSSTMCHVSIGQEAVAVGVCDILGPDDYITSTHRGHGHYLARGGTMEGLIAELMGKETGACRGRGSSMHLVDSAIGHLGSNAIVGGHIPIATGAALWSALTGDGRVTVAFFGDGATTEGIFHESVNFAALAKLPIVFVVENNHYAMSLPWERSTVQPSIAKKAEGYGVTGADVDGMDVVAVRQAATWAVDAARRGDGPTLLGLETYRFLGHSRADPSAYRAELEESTWKQRDPVVLSADRLRANGIGEEEITAIEASIAEEIRTAIAAAEQAPQADLAAVFTDIYATPVKVTR